MGVKIKGSEVFVLKPGTYWWNARWSEVYEENVRPRSTDLCDQLLTTKDGLRVRAGGVLRWGITNIETWLVNNDSPEQSLLVDAGRVIREHVVEHTFEELQSPSARLRRSDAMTKEAQRELGASYGVRIQHLRLSTFARTNGLDIYHAGVSPAQLTTGEEEGRATATNRQAGRARCRV